MDELGAKGFSLWCDFIERDFLENGFKELIAKGIINGATSNPAIFQKAFMSSLAYRDSIATLRGKTPKEIYEALAIQDIARAADLLRPLYDKNRDHGWVSIEVDPFLCDDAEASIKEGERLYRAINRPNVMIKIPATQAGFLAMEALLTKGISVNATLIFSPKQAEECLAAFERGYAKTSENLKAVISIFVSRLDRHCDAGMRAAGLPEGELGVMNAQRICALIQKRALPKVRALFASTGVKGDALRPSYYIDRLLHANSVNTAPLETIEAFLDSKDRALKTLPSPKEQEEFFTAVAQAGIDLDAVFDLLLEQGLELFKDSFSALLASLE